VVIGDKIRFGLAGIKGIGDAAIDAIVEARESGHFTGIYDFCERVDLKRVNKRVIEALIKSGAFDDIESVNRASLTAVIDDAVQFGQSIQKDKGSNQISMFDLLASSGPPPKPKIPLLKEWPEKERLQQEKETLGFYISGHPLQRLEKDLKRFASANIADLSDYPSGSEVTIAGIITSKRNMVTKKGDPMAFIVIEDMTGNIEVSVFPRLFTEVCALLDTDEPLLVCGEIESDENQVRMKGSEIRSLIAARNEKAREIHLHLTSADLSEAAARHMLQIFHQHQGSCLALLHLTIPQRSETLIRLPEHIRVEPNEAFEEAIENLFGPRVLSLR
jgi:DNA polymerase-3 subunit alpha